jgi:DNA-binding transcriptional LysR family regulator
VVDAARLVLRGVADLAATAASVATLRQGTVEIVALPTLAVDPLAALLGRFRTEHPGILVRVREPEDPTDLERMVRSGEVELGLSDITTGGPGLVRVELFRQEVVVVAPPNSTLPEGPISARSMAALPLVVTPAGTSTRRLLDRALARDGHTPVIAVEIGSREAIVPLVLAGAGAALLPRSLADDAAARGAQVRSMHPKLTRRVGLLHRDSRLSPAAAALLAMAVAMPPQF